MINIFDGRRKPISPRHNLLVRIIDGNQNKQFDGPAARGRIFPAPSCWSSITSSDNYTDYCICQGVTATQGCTPGKISPNSWQRVDLMLLPIGCKPSIFGSGKVGRPADFATEALPASLIPAQPRHLPESAMKICMENQGPTLAAFFNITTAMAAIYLPTGTALDYVKQLIWDQMYPTRFFAYADKQMVNQVIEAAGHGQFAPEYGAALASPWCHSKLSKQVQSGESECPTHDVPRRRDTKNQSPRRA